MSFYLRLDLDLINITEYGKHSAFIVRTANHGSRLAFPSRYRHRKQTQIRDLSQANQD